MSRNQVQGPTGGNGGNITSFGGSDSPPPSVVLRPLLSQHLTIKRCGIWQISGFLEAAANLHPGYVEPDAIARCVETYDALPNDDTIQAALAVLEDDAAGDVTRQCIAAITAAMCDAIPTFDVTRSPGYLDALLLTIEVEFAVEAFSPRALAGAAYGLLCTETFAPPPAKLVEAIRAEETNVRNWRRILRLVLERRAKLRGIAGAAKAEASA